MQTVAREERGDRTRLVRADFDRRQAKVGEHARKLGRQRAISIEPFATGEQRLVRLKLAHAWPEVRILRDIRWIAEDEVKLLDQPLSPIALQELQPAFKAEAPGVRGRVGQRLA